MTLRSHQFTVEILGTPNAPPTPPVIGSGAACRLSRLSPTKTTFGIPSDATESNYGAVIKYNADYNLVIVSDPTNKYDSSGTGWIGSGSGAVYVYTYASHTPTLVQKIVQPESVVSGKYSTRHNLAEFGYDIDTFGSWLIIGCPGNYLSPTGVNLSSLSTYSGTITGVAPGGCYIYKWNGSTFDYIQKISPKTFLDLSTEPIPLVDFTEYNIRKQAARARFGHSVCIDKSSLTSFNSSTPLTQKYVAIGGPTASNPLNSSSTPQGGVWLIKNTGSTSWEFASERMNAESFGGTISGGGGIRDNPTDYTFDANTDKTNDPYGLLYYASRYTHTTPADSSSLYQFGSDTGSQVRSNFGSKVAIGGNDTIGCPILIVGAQNATPYLVDTIGDMREPIGSLYYFAVPYDASIGGPWLRNPSVRQNDNLFEQSSTNNSYLQNRQMYLASDVVRGDLSVDGHYSRSFLGYNSFLESDPVADTATNIVQYNAGVTLHRTSRGYIDVEPLTGSTYELQSDSTEGEYCADERFFLVPALSGSAYSGVATLLGSGVTDIKIEGKYAFISIPNLARHTGVVGEASSGDVSQYEVCSAILIINLDYFDGTNGYGGPFSSANGPQIFLLAPPADYRIGESTLLNCVAGFGLNFDVKRESATSWIISTSCLIIDSYQSSYGETLSTSGNYAYDVLESTSKVLVYRMTDGSPPSISEIFSKTLEGVSDSDFYGYRVSSGYFIDGVTKYFPTLRTFVPSVRTRFVNTAIYYVSSTNMEIIAGWDINDNVSKSLYTIYTTSYCIDESAFAAFV